ncbi:MAG: DNA cytosine methyltransferase [Candidatus Hinthialibacter antarcticus]|nr:DNA cytosine methyltransferase [Candidatus Hinthialibacter antarcticus]
MSNTFVDLFCGAGGLSHGLINAGWHPVAAIDNWQLAIDTYRHNMNSHSAYCLDISDIDEYDIFKILNRPPDWVVGGPPCQGFSTVGRRRREDPRNSLVKSFLKFVQVVNPKGVIIENVIGLKDMKFVEEICLAFLEIGFYLTPTIIKAADYGVPQLRKRIFFIGTKEPLAFEMPSPLLRPESYVSVKDAIGDLPELSPGGCADSYNKEPFSKYQKMLRNGSKCIQGHEASNHPKHLVKAISFIPDGGNRFDIPTKYQPASGYHNSYSRLHSNSPAVAVTQNMGKPSGTRCIHPIQNRGLTAREGARLQGFPDSFHFMGGITLQRLQIANAVSPILAKFIGESISKSKSWHPFILQDKDSFVPVVNF